MADISKVVPGGKIKASTINSLIDSIPDLETKGTVSFTKSGAKWNLEVPEQLNFQRKGQKFNQPFDLSTNNCLSGADELSIQVVRPHLPNSEGGLDDISVISPMTFPAQSEVSVWLCELSGQLSGQKIVRSSQDSELEDVSSSRLMWRILSNGVVAEDLRWSALRGSDLSSEEPSSELLLDLSSLNWTSGSSQVSAQTWHYDELLSDDLVDILYVATPPLPPEPEPQPTPEELSVCIDRWRFLVRPEDGGTMHYASLSALLSGMDCQISATPLNVLSNNLSDEAWLSGQGLAEGDETLQNHFVCVAKYKNTGQTWEEADKIWAPNWWYLKQSLDQTPFWLDIRDSSHMFVRNCWLYVGRTFVEIVDTQVNGRATYYVEINTQLPNQPTATIHRVGGQQFPAGRPNNTDTLTYYPLWYLPSTVDYRNPLQTPVDLRGIWKLPFYSL